MQKAVITLDFINEICHPKGKLSRYFDRIAEGQTIEHANEITAWARKEGYLVIHVRVGFRPHYLDCSNISAVFSAAKQHGALAVDQWGGQFCDQLQKEASDIEITKHRVSAFYGTDLDLILRSNQVQELILIGVE